MLLRPTIVLRRRSLLRRAMPSMYQRRLRLLALLVLAVTVVLWVQLARLTIAEHAVLRERAEQVLTRRRLIPVARGRILDRHQRVLAQDRASHDVAVSYEVISGRWAYRQGWRAALRGNRDAWPTLATRQREALAFEAQKPFDAQVEMLWHHLADAGGITRVELAERQAEVVRRVQKVSSHVWMNRLSAHAGEAPVTLGDVAQPVAEQVTHHALLPSVEPELIAHIRRLIDRAQADPELAVWREVVIEPSRQRDYPLETLSLVIDRSHLPSPVRSDEPIEMRVSGVAMHLVGTIRDVWAEDLRRRPFRHEGSDGRLVIDLGGYRPGDRTGSTGIEAAQENRLRGLRGQEIEDLETLEKRREEPVPGQDVVLTIDAQLQARIQALMDPALGLMRRQAWHSPQTEGEAEPDQPFNGAAVVLDVVSGQVLAAVSVPTIGLAEIRRNPEAYYADGIDRPYINRPIAMPYQPGSTVKPLVLAAAMTSGRLGPDEAIHCGGHLDPGAPHRYRCWYYKGFNLTHGDLASAEAIARSCNIFFFTLGRRLGAVELVSWYDRFGLGAPLGCGLGEEIGGDLPDLAQANYPNAAGFASYDAINMGIGQGPVRLTALQAANSYATLARGGYSITPTFLLAAAQQDNRDLQLHPRGVELALEGLAQSVSESFGTGHHIYVTGPDGQRKRENIFDIDRVKLFGKTGTADAAPLREVIDDDGDGYPDRYGRIIKDGDHAWFVGLVQREDAPRPNYAIAVIVEYAGSGGSIAGPVANQILHALRAEGYL